MEEGKHPVEAPTDKEQSKPTFKILAIVVKAVRRFQLALNPTYEFGENKNESQTAPKLGARGLSGRLASGRTTSGKTFSGRLSEGGQHHGYKGNLLFKPLPDLPDEAAGAKA